MTVIGIVGGIASGKSLVAWQLGELGAVVINGDKIGHDVLRDPQVIAALRDAWGGKVVHSDGTVDRGVLAESVFGNDSTSVEQLQCLERITHPRIEQRLRDRIEEIEKTSRKVAVLDAAVMVKSGWDALCDIIVFVEAPPSVRRQRVIDRGWDVSQLESRERAQVDIQSKRDMADFVIDNGGLPEQTHAQVRAFWNSLSHKGLSHDGGVEFTGT